MLQCPAYNIMLTILKLNVLHISWAFILINTIYVLEIAYQSHCQIHLKIKWHLNRRKSILPTHVVVMIYNSLILLKSTCSYYKCMTF